MFSIDGPCFLLSSDEQKERFLFSGHVRELRHGKIVVQFDDAIATKPGDQLVLLAESRQSFLQQSFTVACVRSDAVIELIPVGSPAPAGRRRSYRVRVAGCDLFASVDDQANCRVVDVSPEGLAVISGDLLIGQIVKISIEHEGIIVKGKMSVQTRHELARGRLRFGLRAVDPKSGIGLNLQKLAMLFQRGQLKRLAGAA
jgi:PilZ domain